MEEKVRMLLNSYLSSFPQDDPNLSNNNVKMRVDAFIKAALDQVRF